MTRVTCPHCSRPCSTQKTLAPGTRVRCPGCNERFEVPEDEPGPLDAETVDAGDPSDGFDLASIGLDPTDMSGVVGLADDDPPAVGPMTSWMPKADPPAAPPPTAAGKPSPIVIPPEPSYYRWLDIYARVMAAITRAAFVLLAVPFTLAVFLLGYSFIADELNGATVRLTTLTSMLWLFVGFVGLFPFYASCLLLRLAVDLARNIRATRYR